MFTYFVLNGKPFPATAKRRQLYLSNHKKTKNWMYVRSFTCPSGIQKVTQAAIKIGDWIYVGHRHHNIIHEIFLTTGKRLYDLKVETGLDPVQGFVTDRGEFLDRLTAATLVIENGQVQKLQFPPLLYSEDLY